LGHLRYEKAIDRLGILLLDENWQVRNASAHALATIGDASIDVFLGILRHVDRYSKESVCEEIERTNLVQKLIDHLKSDDHKIYEQSKEILSMMHSLNFSTPLYEYIKGEGEERIIKEIDLILMRETSG